MSYCRPGEDSDMYAIKCGKYWAITPSMRDSIMCSSLEDFKLWLLLLRSQGYKVPERVFERIKSEETCGA